MEEQKMKNLLIASCHLHSHYPNLPHIEAILHRRVRSARHSHHTRGRTLKTAPAFLPENVILTWICLLLFAVPDHVDVKTKKIVCSLDIFIRPPFIFLAAVNLPLV